MQYTLLEAYLNIYRIFLNNLPRFLLHLATSFLLKEFILPVSPAFRVRWQLIPVSGPTLYRCRVCCLSPLAITAKLATKLLPSRHKDRTTWMPWQLHLGHIDEPNTLIRASIKWMNAVAVAGSDSDSVRGPYVIGSKFNLPFTYTPLGPAACLHQLTGGRPENPQ